MSANEQTPQTSPSAPEGREHQGDLAGLRILIVEDSSLVALNLRAMLEQLGCLVVGVAARLDEAMESARTKRLDGVLLDLNLAGLDSYPVAAILAERNIPFVLISGYDHSYVRADFTGAAHLQKPYSVDALAAIMRSTFA